MNASAIIGGGVKKNRSPSDYYPTPPECTQALLDFLQLRPQTVIWEPACGKGHISAVLKNNGYNTVSTDIQKGVDFLKTECRPCDWIITNPPFSLADEFIRRAAKTGKPFAFLLKSQFWHAQKRLDIFSEFHPAYLLPLTWRPDFNFENSDGKRHNPPMDCIWCVWKPGWPRETIYRPLSRPTKGGRKNWQNAVCFRKR